jgi:acylphosphatase
MAQTDKARLHAVVKGYVQGVGFRYFVLDAAVALGLSGWVRNLWDGDVELIAEGEREALEKLLPVVRRGPRAAHVSGVDIEWGDYKGEFSSFHVKSTF